MPRRHSQSRHSQVVTPQSSQSRSSNELVEQMLRKEESYRTGIKENQMLAQTLAQRLAHGGVLDRLLEDVSEHRDRLKKLAENNVLQERNLSAFMKALGNVKNDNANNDDIEDYQAALDKSMETELQKISRSSVDVSEEPMYLEICTKLGEGSAMAGGDDDELEVLATESTVNLKCPLQGSLMEDPVKNKRCGHVYSKLAIYQHIKIDRKCPVFGCGNNEVKIEDLEADRETEYLIRREKIRQEHLKVQQSQNAIDADDDDEENLL